MKISGEDLVGLKDGLEDFFRKFFINIFREPEYVELESTDEYVKVPVRIGPDKTYQ